MPDYCELVPVEVIKDGPDEGKPVGELVVHAGRVVGGQAVAGLVKTNKPGHNIIRYQVLLLITHVYSKIEFDG